MDVTDDTCIEPTIVVDIVGIEPTKGMEGAMCPPNQGKPCPKGAVCGMPWDCCMKGDEVNGIEDIQVLGI